MRVLGTAIALPIAQLVVGGFRIGAGLSLSRSLGTLLVVALLLCALQAVTAGPRRFLLSVLPRPTLTVIAALLLNGLVCYGAIEMANAAGLAAYVAGYLPALCASLVLPIVAGLMVTAADGLRPEVRRG